MKHRFDGNLPQVRGAYSRSTPWLGAPDSGRFEQRHFRSQDLGLISDTDFVAMANTLGHPPKVIIILENCDYPTSVAAQLINANRIRIFEFEGNDHPLLILPKP